MKKTLVTLALATVPALLLSACNGGNQAPTAHRPCLPPRTAWQAVPNPMTTDRKTCTQAAPTFPAYAYNLGTSPSETTIRQQPGRASVRCFYSAPTTGTVYYCLTNSGAGRKAFEGGPDEDSVLRPPGRARRSARPRPVSADAWIRSISSVQRRRSCLDRIYDLQTVS